MRFYIIRHGETDWNNLGKIQGTIDNPLNETGKLQAKEISSFFNQIIPTHLVHSSLGRAKETMAILKQEQGWDLNPEINDAFLERNFGALEGCQGKDFYAVEDFSKIDNYETDALIEARTCAGLEKYTNNDDNIVVVTSHSHAIRSILIALFPEQFAWDESSKLKNCAIVEIEYTDNKFNLIGIH